MLHVKLANMFLLSSLMVTNCAFAQTTPRQVAITIDHLPYADSRRCDEQETLANTKELLDPIRTGNIPVVGFVVGERCRNLSPKQRRDLLKMWLDAGVELGNHTWSHPDLNQVPLEEYEKQILRTDDNLQQIIGPLRIKYFRAPYLHDGATAETKRPLQSFLAEHRYQEAPVTLDNNDWAFAAAYSRAIEKHNGALAKRIEDAYIPYIGIDRSLFRETVSRSAGQRLSTGTSDSRHKTQCKDASSTTRDVQKTRIHICRPRSSYERRKLPHPGHVCRSQGLPWIHRWGITRGKTIQLEPDEPDWVDRIASQH